MISLQLKLAILVALFSLVISIPVPEGGGAPGGFDMSAITKMIGGMGGGGKGGAPGGFDLGGLMKNLDLGKIMGSLGGGGKGGAGGFDIGKIMGSLGGGGGKGGGMPDMGAIMKNFNPAQMQGMIQSFSKQQG